MLRCLRRVQTYKDFHASSYDITVCKVKTKAVATILVSSRTSEMFVCVVYADD